MHTVFNSNVNKHFSYLSQGSSWQMLAWAFRIGVSTIREIILETCEAIWDELHPIYLAQPNQEEYKKIATDFYNMTGMANCVGAIDGKHIRIKCPPNGGSLYYNYKSFHSIVLLAACDSNYCFTAVDIGAYGSQSDGGILQASGFGNQLLSGQINLPTDQCLPNSNVLFPYYFVGDAAFPLKKNIMRPYPGRMLSQEKAIFNKKLSSARVKIENTFGVMCARWRVLLNAINCFPENVEKIVKAVVVLHNFTKMHDGEYCPANYVDSFNGDILVEEGLWRKETKTLPQYRLFTRFNATRSAFDLRESLKNYLNSM